MLNNRDDWINDYEDIKQRLLRLFRSFGSFTRRYGVEDLLQEVFLRLMLACRSKSINSPKSYAWSIAFNLVQSLMLQDKRMRDAMSEIRLMSEDDVWSSYNCFEIDAEREERVETLAADLADYLRAVFQRRRSGMTHGQIAAELGLSTKTVQTYVSLAIKKIREKLQEEAKP